MISYLFQKHKIIILVAADLRIFETSIVVL